MSAGSLETRRLVLREWRDEDLPEFARINADPRVMEWMPRILSREESDAMVARIRRGFAKHGFGLWAVGVKGGASFVGFVGLAVPRFEAHFMPCVEIGWRLAFEHWRHGFATEAARRTLQFAFTKTDLSEIVSFTATVNQRSRRVMERIGMHHSAADDFHHPSLPDDHPLKPHILYRLTRRDWIAPQGGRAETVSP